MSERIIDLRNIPDIESADQITINAWKDTIEARIVWHFSSVQEARQFEHENDGKHYVLIYVQTHHEKPIGLVAGWLRDCDTTSAAQLVKEAQEIMCAFVRVEQCGK